MEVDVPGNAAARQRAALEEELASVFQTLLEDGASAQDVVNQTYHVCLGRVEAFRCARPAFLCPVLPVRRAAERRHVRIGTFSKHALPYNPLATNPGRGLGLRPAGAHALNRGDLAD